MLEGEFHSMSALYEAAPGFVPKPCAWGKLNVTNPDTYYFLCDFIEMTNESPDPVQLATKLTQLHQDSVSPTGQFDFHINTCQGNLAQDTKWNPSWVAFFIQLVRGAMKLNKEIDGDRKDLEPCVERLITHVVPRVLGPLEQNGRQARPASSMAISGMAMSALMHNWRAVLLRCKRLLRALRNGGSHVVGEDLQDPGSQSLPGHVPGSHGYQRTDGVVRRPASTLQCVHAASRGCVP